MLQPEPMQTLNPAVKANVEDRDFNRHGTGNADRARLMGSHYATPVKRRLSCFVFVGSGRCHIAVVGVG